MIHNKTLRVILFAGIILVASCTAMKFQRINADMSLINLGMSQDTVVKKIGKPNMVVVAQSTDDGPLEVYEYLRLEYNSYTKEHENRPIWVYFVNKEVVEWGPGEDWQMDNAITQRILDRYRHQKSTTRRYGIYHLVELPLNQLFSM